MKKMFLRFCVVTCAIALSGFVFYSCGNNDDEPGDDPNLPKDPSTIASANLIAHWGFEDSPKDAVGQRGTATSAVTYAKGQRGKAYQGKEGAYISFDLPNSDAFATMKGYTMAAWIKAPKVSDKGLGMIFQLTGTEFLGSLALFQENLWLEGGNDAYDFLGLKAFFTKEKQNEGDWVGHDWKVDNENFPAGKWFHLVYNYDNAVSKAFIYVNGILLMVAPGPFTLETRYRTQPGTIMEEGVVINENPNNAPKLGDLKLSLKDEGNKGIIGFWTNRAFDGAQDDWMGYYYGMLDELRFYNRALTADEVKKLYDAEVAKLD